jgi:type III restriction enzyme
MARKRKEDSDQLGLLDARVSTAPLVPGIRGKVKAWREGGYKGISDTTRILLNYWFYTDHRLPNGRKFAYHYFQREAVETLIYLYEVAKVRRDKGLVETFGALAPKVREFLETKAFGEPVTLNANSCSAWDRRS